MTAQVKQPRRCAHQKPDRPSPARKKAASGSAPESRVYVYGIFPGDIRLDSGLMGVGDPPGKVRIVRCGDIAALVSDVGASWSLGTAEDLTAHKEILDACATAVPVLPMRFGAMLSDDDAVTSELLAANHDLFAAALDELEGLVQYIVKGRYQETAILREVLHEDRGAARLAKQVRGAGADASRSAKIRLGETLSRAVAAKREQDKRTLARRLDGHCAATVFRQPAHERDAVHVALLVKTAETEQLQRAVHELAAEWEGRVDMRLLGPMAPYDFVGNTGSGV